MENQDKPSWWPKNPYATDEPMWSHKPDNEVIWEEASDDIFEAWSKAMKEMWENYKVVGNPK